MRGWRAALGCTGESLALFRISLGILLSSELLLRFRFLRPFYSNEGMMPLSLMLEKVDDLYKLVCFLHCRLGELWQQQLLLSLQVIVAVLFTFGYKTRLTSFLSWSLYLSLTLRNTWLNYILDRYFHYLLFLSFILSLDECWAISSSSPKKRKVKVIIISPATIALKALVVWIYLDAGWGKYASSLGGWTYGADPLPALDTYTRHTLAARYMYAILGPPGLRLLTPVVVYIELLVAPVSLVACFIGSRTLLYVAISLIWSLHVGIALTMRNAALLSLVACVAWCPFLPVGWKRLDTELTSLAKTPQTSQTQDTSTRSLISWSGTLASTSCIFAMACGSIWLETKGQACDQSVRHIWGTIFHNRWNVFVDAEQYGAYIRYLEPDVVRHQTTPAHCIILVTCPFYDTSNLGNSTRYAKRWIHR
jgi:hypothetical protein